ncbi:MAG: hypothetical protein VW455_05515 [Nitrospinota bacterium]
MHKNIPQKLLLIFIFSSLFSGLAFANYKHKVIVTEFDDPPVWNRHFSPGKVLSERLENELIRSNVFQMISTNEIKEMAPHEMPQPEMMELPHKAMPENSNKRDKAGNMMKMNKPGAMNKAMDEPKAKMMGNKRLSQKPFKNSFKRENSFRRKRPTPTYRSEGSHASYENQWNLEPAVHTIYDEPQFELIPVQNPSNAMMKKKGSMGKGSMMDKSDPDPWPAKLGKMPVKASLYKIKGQVVKFDPGALTSETDDSDKLASQNSENAELEVKLQLVQNKTGRVVKKRTFRAFSNSGRRPFAEDIDLAPTDNSKLSSSSMGLALTFLTKEMVGFLKETIRPSALEGEIISMQDEEVLINVGTQNGVRVGDKFHVYAVGLELGDPLTEMDLGDIYVKMGLIQVLDVMKGFSKAAIIVGKDFMPGNLVQSLKKTLLGSQKFSSGPSPLEEEEIIP